MTTTTTLVDRYVDETLRRVPGRQRQEIERELRASIADAVDDRVRAGGDPTEAERAVLNELGDPARLAAAYADRPLHLIGPALYLDYTRLLAALLATVLPAVAVAVGALQIPRDDSLLSALGNTAGTTFTVGLHIAFWTTIVFAVADRVSAQSGRGTTEAARAPSWTVAAMQDPPPSRVIGNGEMIAATVMLGIFTTFVLLSPTVSTELDSAGDPIGVLSPRLWTTGIVYVFLALAIAGVGLTFVARYAQWSLTLAGIRALVEAACPIILIWLVANDRILNPAFVSAAGWSSDVERWIAFGLVLIGAGAIVRVVLGLVAGIRHRAWTTANWKTLIRTAADGISHMPRR